MRVAQVAPLMESVPPRYYGGTERVVSYLTEALVRQGHDVTLFASGDSRTAARLVAVGDQALRLHPARPDPLAYHILELEEVWKRRGQFDVIHFHVDLLHLPMARRIGVPNVTTLHGRLDLPHLVPMYREFQEVPLISISHAQRRPIPWANWRATVYHGLPRDLYSLVEEPSDYLAFLGRISPEKRLDRAIEIARRAGMRLRVAAKVDPADEAYFQERIRPLLGLSHVEYLGEIGEADKGEFLGRARALLFPIDWPEPFGLVMIEAMACGTPVVAYRGGSVEEILEPGVTGFIVDTLEAAVEAVGHTDKLSRRRIREVFESRFTAERMASDTVAVYQQLLGEAAGAQRVA